MNAGEQEIRLNGHRCINPDCHSKGKKKKAFALGLCGACGMRLRRALEDPNSEIRRRGITTLEEAADAGYCLHKGRQRARKTVSPALPCPSPNR